MYDNNVEGAEDAKKEKEGWGFKLNEAVDYSMTATDGILYGSQKIANIATKSNRAISLLEDVPVLSQVSTVATGITVGHKLYQAFEDPKHHWFDGAEGATMLTVALVAAPEVVLAVGVVISIIDLFRE